MQLFESSRPEAMLINYTKEINTFSLPNII